MSIKAKQVAGVTSLVVLIMAAMTAYNLGTLAQLHNRLSSMSSKDPNEWQKVLQDYAVAASALFVTLNSDDDD